MLSVFVHICTVLTETSESKRFNRSNQEGVRVVLDTSNNFWKPTISSKRARWGETFWNRICGWAPWAARNRLYKRAKTLSALESMYRTFAKSMITSRPSAAQSSASKTLWV